MKSENQSTISLGLIESPEFKEAYREHERRQRIQAGKVGAALVAVLMPAGFTLDYFVYPERVREFFVLRLACSVVAIAMFLLHRTKVGLNSHRVLGMAIVLAPAFFIDWMIWATEGTASPYYAGLNLILLALNVVLHWSLLESFITVASIIGMYLIAIFARPDALQNFGLFFNNLYFLVLTGIIVITGNFFFNRLRFREFALRYELDRNRAALEENNEKLVELGQVKDRFFANISHELRTPLTLLLSPLETIQNRRDANFDPQTRTLFGIMHSNGMRLLKLINDLLDLVRLESGRMELRREAMEMSAFINGIASAARQMAENKNVALQLTVEPNFGAVMVDRDKLEKVVLNMVFNALKFTPKGGKVDVNVAREGEEFVLTVRDSGIGIAAKNLPYIFDRFWQADGSSKRNYKGVGIGLSLVKELTELHGGKVSVESVEGRGTTFTVRIPYVAATSTPVATGLIEGGTTPISRVAEPIQDSPQQEEWLTNLYRRAELFSTEAEATKIDSTAPLPATNGDRQRLLVADDEPDMLRFLKSQLVDRFSVIEAVNGQEAVDFATREVPNIILLDMNMPEKDGLQVCRELRAEIVTRNVPIVMLTARADEETKLAALTAGANDFLPKPFSTTELHLRIKNLLETQDYQVRLAEKNQLLEETIEQLKRTETQLVQTEKMASLGRLSAGIIHEINNPLNYAATGLFTLRKKGKLLAPEEQPKFVEIVRDIEDGIERVKNIVVDLRKFTHPDDGPREVINVETTVKSTLRFFSGEWTDQVQMTVDLPENMLIVGSQNRTLQVFINLVQNAIDAVKSKTFIDGEKPTIAIKGHSEAGRNFVTIRDNGTGIEPGVIDKIFDPFFTTKDVGAGMGLGLSICYQIVQECGGKITATSEPGKFTELSLEFPAHG